MVALVDALTENVLAVSEVLDRVLPEEDGPEVRLLKAMRYATLGGGKRIRPFLVTASAGLFGVDREPEELPLLAKDEVAEMILDRVSEIVESGAEPSG